MPGPSSPCPSTRSPRVSTPGEIDTVLLAFTDMQGRLQGKRLHARYFLDEVLEHGTEGCNYLLAVDVDMNTVDGYAMSSWERGYGDFVMHARPRHAAPGALAARHRRCCWPTCSWQDGSPRRRRRPGRSCAASSTGSAELGFTAYAGTELEFIVFERHLRAGLATRLPRPDPGQPVQRRLLAARHRAGRAAAAPHPQRDGRRRADGRVGQGRVQPRPARDRLPLRRGARHLRQPRRLQERRQGDRRPGGHVAHLHGQVDEREGNSCHIHLSLRGTDGVDRHRRRPATGTARAAARCSAASSPGSSPRCASFTLLFAPNINSYKRFAAGLVRADRGAPGAWTTAPARCGWSATGRAAGGEPGARRRRQPVPGARRR